MHAPYTRFLYGLLVKITATCISSITEAIRRGHERLNIFSEGSTHNKCTPFYKTKAKKNFCMSWPQAVHKDHKLVEDFQCLNEGFAKQLFNFQLTLRQRDLMLASTSSPESVFPIIATMYLDAWCILFTFVTFQSFGAKWRLSRGWSSRPKTIVVTCQGLKQSWKFSPYNVR